MRNHEDITNINNVEQVGSGTRLVYEVDFKNQIIAVCKSGVYESVAACAKAYNLSPSTLHTWLNKYNKKSAPGAVTDQSVELARVKKELIRAKMELEILKKAIIYFANQAQ